VVAGKLAHYEPRVVSKTDYYRSRIVKSNSNRAGTSTSNRPPAMLMEHVLVIPQALWLFDQEKQYEKELKTTLFKHN
jgi:hypothetical protein